MKKRTVIDILIVSFLLISIIVVICNRNQEDAEIIHGRAPEIKVTEIEETTVESVSDIEFSAEYDGLNGEKEENKAEDETEKETNMSEITKESPEESAETISVETMEMPINVIQESTEPVSTEEQKTAETDTNTNTETGSESTENGKTEESSTESDREIYASEYGIYGDTGEKQYDPCNEEHYCAVLGRVCDPEFYRLKYADVYFEEVLALSDKYKKEHPFSEGSVLKPCFPNIRKIVWFTDSFEKRYVVLKAYDTSNVKKYFLIEFTITDNYELDTVSIRELADDEVGE